MTFSTWFLFSSVALVAILSPGPAILLAISNSLQYGVKKVLLSSLGNISGLFILSTAAVLGMGAVLKTSTSLFLLLKIIGAFYLIYLGIKQWRSKHNLFDKKQNKNEAPKNNSYFYLEGFLIAITNPKAILFFTALFPQFIDLNKELIPQFLIMTLTFMGLSFLVLTSYGLLAYKAKKWFSTSRRVNWFNRIIGSLFILLGVALSQLKIVNNE